MRNSGPGFRRENSGVINPLGIFDQLPGDDDTQFALLLAICRNTAVMAELLERILDELSTSR